LLGGWEPAKCDVEEREIRREKEADVLRDAGAQRADGHAQGFGPVWLSGGKKIDEIDCICLVVAGLMG